MKFTKCVLSLILVILFLSACGRDDKSDHEEITLTIFAAASLTDAFQEIAERFEQSNPGVTVALNFGGSSTLAAQITQGAPADVFASANVRQMDVVRESGDIVDDPTTFATNRLIVIVPADNPANIESLMDLSNDDILLVIAAQGVPVRDYTDIMLERMAASDEYGEVYREAVLNNVVSEELNVRLVSSKVALGEGDAGIVYASDVTPDIAINVTTISIPDKFNTIATYPIAVTTHAEHPDLAQDFVNFVLSDEGQDILTKWNFISIRDVVSAQ